MLNESKMPLTEADVRRIIREELDAWQEKVSPVLDGPTQRMREITRAAAMTEGES